jgi:hypothetical protein
MALSARYAVAGNTVCGDNPRSLSVCQVPSADIADRRDDLCVNPPAAAAMVSGDLSSDADQARHLQHRGVALAVTQTTAWKIKHKLKQVMLERDATKRLSGRIEIDDAYLGGERSGGKRGRGAPGKTPFVAAVETTTAGKPVRLKLRRVTSFCATSIAGFAKCSLDPDCSVVSDGFQCFASVADAGCAHQVVKTGSGPKAARTPAFKWVNTALGNIKAAITGTYRAINSKHVPRYLAEFEHRFNRRYDLAAMIPRLTWAAVRTTPMPYWLLKLAEVYA